MIPSTFTYDGILYSVTSIGSYAFEKCTNLHSVEIPNSVTGIGSKAFYGCTGLSSILIGSSVEYIGDEAFNLCYSLTNIVFPNSITDIGQCAFIGCGDLKSVTFGNSIKRIGKDAFSNCSRLNKVIVTDIAAWCSINFENNYSNPLSYAHHFYTDENTELTELIIPNTVTSIGNLAFYNCSSITNVKFSDSVISIGDLTFQNCSNIKNIVFSNSITIIGGMAFSNCSNLTSVEIPNSVITIKEYAFQGCTSLKSIIIPNSVTYIGDCAFAYCDHLAIVYSYIIDIFDISTNVFDGCNENMTLFVPHGKLIIYRATQGWSRFKYIEEMKEDVSNSFFLLSCNSKGSITINGTIVFTNKIGSVDILEDAENTIVFTPKANCKLEQVCFNGFDVTTSVENNTLKAVIPAKSQMVVTFAKESGDMNNDGIINISDVVLLVNMILGQ